MDIILNDLSLNNQYTSLEDFILCYKENLLPLIILFEKISTNKQEKTSIYKSSDFFSREIFDHKTFQQLLQIKGKTVIQQILSILTTHKQPFWDQQMKTRDDDIQSEFSVPNCITEAFYRNICLISFPKSNFTENTISLIINKRREFTRNAITEKQFIESFPSCYNIEIKQGQDIEINNKSFKFEIRDNEGGEVHDPHFHLTEKDGNKDSVKIRINKNFDLIRGPKKLRDECFLWCKENYLIIKVLWNYRHGNEHKVEE